MRRLAMIMALALVLTTVLAACNTDSLTEPMRLEQRQYSDELVSARRDLSWDLSHMYELFGEAAANPSLASDDLWKHNVKLTLDSLEKAPDNFKDVRGPEGTDEVTTSMHELLTCWAGVAERSRPHLDANDVGKLQAEFDNAETCTTQMQNVTEQVDALTN